jgi:hypothetical protein
MGADYGQARERKPGVAGLRNRVRISGKPEIRRES